MNPRDEKEENDVRDYCVPVAMHHECHGLEEVICVCIVEEHTRMYNQNNSRLADLPESVGWRSTMDNWNNRVFGASLASVVSRSRVDNKHIPVFGD